MARDYAKFSHRFWIGETGRKIRSNRSAQVLAAYLITAPGSTMTGIYYLPLPVVAHETGMTDGEVSSALAFLKSIDFAHYDPHAELVWIPAMAAWQIDEELKPGDKRVIGVRREMEAMRGHPFAVAFWERYREAFCLGDAPFQRASQAPSKPLRSQEHEQEHSLSLSGSLPPVPLASDPDPDPRAIPLPQAPYLPPRERPRTDRFAAASSGAFDRVFAVYPRKDAKVPAQDAFAVAASMHPGGEDALADAILAAFPSMLKRHPYNGPNDKRPFLETVIAQRRWEDPESAPYDVKPAATGPPRGQPSTATHDNAARVLASLEKNQTP